MPKNNKEAPSQRVSVDEARGRYKVGTIISKKFDGIAYKGKIIKPFDGGYYKIEYEDGDEEEMTHSKVRKHLPGIQYTGGWGAALQAICRQTTEINSIALESLHEAQNIAFAVTHPVTGKQMEYRDLVKDPAYAKRWKRSKANELGRLLQGAGKKENGEQRIKGYNCCDVIHKHEVEKGQTITYAQTVCTVRPEKDEPDQTRITAGGNLLDYPGDTSTDTAGLVLIKMHWQSVLAKKNAKYMTVDIGNFYTNTPMDRFEYMRMHINKIPNEPIDEYNLMEKVGKGCD